MTSEREHLMHSTTERRDSRGMKDRDKSQGKIEDTQGSVSSQRDFSLTPFKLQMFAIMEKIVCELFVLKL